MREQAKIKIKDLVERFRSNLDVYKKTSYNETQLRREYLDPLFDALGWDVANKQGYAEQYKDVVHEDAIKIGVSSKAPDYSFRIGGQRKFFLEAKKPSVNIKDDISPAYQLRRYAWSAKLPLSILTDFEELAIYDCRIKPNPNDGVATGRVAYYTFAQYVEKFDEIYDILSKESVLKGSFDRYIVSAKGKRGTAEVDKEFLKEIESWRDSLAKNIALRNEKLSVKELNFAVQQTIDRVIFLRICEDRGIETYGRLLALQNGGSVYKRLMELFYSADKKYNSGLFDFNSDKLSHTLDIDDKVLKELISGIYYPNSPYEFSVLGADILGNVYEQFLGKVIRLTAGHTAKVEEKPEVKKAGGVYYTPDYIVDYIVKNTLGKLLGDETAALSPLTRGDRGGSINSSSLLVGEPPPFFKGRPGGIEGRGEGESFSSSPLGGEGRGEGDSFSPSPLGGEGRGEGDSFSPSPLEGEGRGEGLNSYNPRLIQLARNLRKNQTDVEKLMWLLVRNNQLGAKFRRQQPIGKYIANFYCSEKKLVIELDGGKHTESKDRPKTEFLNQAGITVLRFWNSEVLENTEGVLQAIWDKINTPHLNPLPQGERKIFKMTPKQVEKIKILDPACGSGSFLIGAYQYLLDYHINWYREFEPEKHAKGKKPAVYKGSGGEWRLTTTEKKRILLNNIFGVDIDRQAVEVTKLSLLLKVLEGENEETLGKTFALFQERALPNLESNIKCGNSLIGPDFYDSISPTLPFIPSHQGRGKTTYPFVGKTSSPLAGKNASSSPSPLAGEGRVRGKNLGDDEADRINVFDWNDNEKGFGRIMKEGGFDCVVGNPPYVRQEMLGEFKPYFESRYTAYHGMADLYVYFIEKAVSLLKEDGLFSYIVANKWMRANYGEPIRRWMKKQAVEEITDFGDLPVFQNATTYPCILRIRKGKPANAFFTAKMSTLDFQDMQEYVNEHKYKVSRSALDNKGWSLAGAAEEALLAKIKSIGVPLGEYVEGKIYRGVLTGLNEAFVIDEDTRKRLIKEDPKSKDIIRPFLIGRDIKRYQTPATDKYLIFTRRGIDIKKYPVIEKYLSRFKERLLPKPKDWKGKEWEGRKLGSYKWYEIQDAIDYYEEFERPKLIWGNLAVHPQFTFDTDNRYINAPANIIQSDDLYLLAILNSPICEWQIKLQAAGRSGGFYEYKPMYVSKLPIRTINFKDKKDKSLHDKMVSLVDNMLELNKKLPNVKTPHERELLERQIKITDNQIDRLVFELYGLTEEEIKVVEGE